MIIGTARAVILVSSPLNNTKLWAASSRILAGAPKVGKPGKQRSHQCGIRQNHLGGFATNEALERVGYLN